MDNRYIRKRYKIISGTYRIIEFNKRRQKKMFKQFGKGDVNLTDFLRQSYKSGLPNIFCCS